MVYLVKQGENLFTY